MNSEHGISELVEKAQTGDTRAENALFTKLRARFSVLVRHRIWNPKKDSKSMTQDVEDVVSEIMEAIYDRLRKGLIPQEHFMATAHAIAHNKIVDYIRKKVKDKKFQSLETEIPFPEKEQPNGIAINLEIKEIILRVLPKLSQRDKEILLAFLKDRIKEYIKEQSRIMSRNRVDTHIHRFRRRFARLLRKEGLEI